jgi:hypothetical protein
MQFSVTNLEGYILVGCCCFLEKDDDDDILLVALGLDFEVFLAESLWALVF